MNVTATPAAEIEAPTLPTPAVGDRVQGDPGKRAPGTGHVLGLDAAGKIARVSWDGHGAAGRISHVGAYSLRVIPEQVETGCQVKHADEGFHYQRGCVISALGSVALVRWNSASRLQSTPVADLVVTRPAPYVGMPATITLVTDTRPAVVTKVNAKSVVVRTVPRIESTKTVRNPDEPLPCVEYQGDTANPHGEPERFAMVSPGRYRNGSIGLILGRSVDVTDYRF